MNGPRSLSSTASALLLAASFVPGLSAQAGTIMGSVSDVQSRAALPGAALILEGTADAGLSGDDGRFMLIAVPSGDHVLRVELIGYRPLRRSVSVPADGAAVVDIALTPEPLAMDEIVVTSEAGIRRGREVGNTVARLEIDEVLDRPPTLSDFLQGAAVGVEVTGGSAEAGQGKQIRLRGNGSMVLSSHPLVYIDGVRMMEGAFPSALFDRPGVGLPGGANVTTSPLDLVSVGDIERIEVIKGPAATTLFGTGSSNGVIRIFTRRGVTGPPRWTAEVSQGTGWVPRFGVNGVDYLHVEHFLRDAWWGGGYEGGAASGGCVTDDPRWEGANGSAEGGCSWPGSQWYQKYRLAVDGGSGIVDYFASAEHQDDTYALPLDRLERYAFRSNLGLALTPSLEARVRAAYTSFSTSNTASGRSTESILLSTMRQNRNLLGSSDPRDIARLLGNHNDQWIDRFTGGLSTTFSRSALASHRLSLGYDFSRQDLRSVYLPGALRPEGATTTRDWDRRLWTLDYLGVTAFTRGQTRSTLSFGGQLVTDDLGWTTRSRVGLAGDVPATSGETGDAETLDLTGSASTAGVFAQNVLALRDRYFLTTGLRVDRHEARDEASFHVDPRVGLAWMASDEAFWPEDLGALRLRAAWGHSSTALSPFLQGVRYWGGAAPANAGPGGMLEPESNAEWEVGLDAAFLDGRVNIGFTRYVQTTTNALVPVTVDAESIPQRQELLNIGGVRNQGTELQLDAAILSTADWAIDAGLGLGTNHSKVLDLGGADTFNEQESRFMVGHPAPLSRGRRVADPDAVNGPWKSDRYLTDAEGNARQPLGPQLPTRFLASSISARIPGGIAVAALGEYRGGNVRFVNPVAVSRRVVSPLCLPYYVDPSTSLDLRPDTPDLWQERCTPAGADDYWFDGDYFKLRSVAATIPVGFALPNRIRDPLLTVTLSNAFTWYREIPWWDVEIPGNDGANGDGVGTSDRVPAPTTVTFVLRFVF